MVNLGSILLVYWKFLCVRLSKVVLLLRMISCHFSIVEMFTFVIASSLSCLGCSSCWSILCPYHSNSFFSEKNRNAVSRN